MQQLQNYAYTRSNGLAATHFSMSQNPLDDNSKASETWLMLESMEAGLQNTLTEDCSSDKLTVCWALFLEETAAEIRAWADAAAGIRQRAEQQ